ncbi:MAG: tRNA epoxyqueuosine(34) reductase QueG [Chloroflexota bacterium]
MNRSLTLAIKSEAHRLGFSLVGITSPEPPPHWSVYQNWLAMGRHGNMAYLAAENAQACRFDPRLILPECKSIIVLGFRYPDPQSVPPPEKSPLHGRVASYAWGQDYHLIIPQRMGELVAWVEQHINGPVASRCYTDTGPILERDLAQRAGLGWIGKNTCLIHPALGSYFFLAEILLDIELAPDEPFVADRCGTCTRCLDMCPTHCILTDRILDARRCISYLTIELKEAIPEELRRQIGNWVFGCDLCQLVCPWNRFARGPWDPALNPGPNSAFPDLLVEISLSAQQFNAQYRNRPLQRARRKGYLRNVAVALGNTRNLLAVNALESTLHDADLLVQEHIRWALEECKR